MVALGVGKALANGDIMGFVKSTLRRVLNRLGYDLYNRNHPAIYSEDGFSTYHNHTFVNDPKFVAAYDRALKANDGIDHNMRWRAQVAFWVASQAVKLPGAFVECGVNTGFIMSGIMQQNQWNDLGKDCFLFDTFGGLDERFVSDTEALDGRLAGYANINETKTRENFAEFDRVHFVVGAVPETLTQVDIPQVCYLSLDMNCTIPEIEAFRHFWPRVVPGGWVVLDDYCYAGYDEQHYAFNTLAEELGFQILALPTGQGLVQKPPV